MNNIKEIFTEIFSNSKPQIRVFILFKPKIWKKKTYKNYQ